MTLSSLFKLRETATPELLELLKSTTLGTNGAKYRHLDTSERILEADSPLFLSLERNEKVIGNITFCRRDKFWYIRYFAFSNFAQAGSTKKNSDKSNSFLKKELNQFFENVFYEGYSNQPVHSMYAYIDPKNDRSKWMSENFRFTTIAQLATQSFSRVNPVQSKRLSLVNDWHELKDQVEQQYGEHAYFFTTHAEKPPFYVLKDADNSIIACTKVTRVNWEIVRIPGKMGGFLTIIIPYIPILRKLINPKKHTFLVPEIVVVKDNNPDLLKELFSSILAKEQLKLMLWWVDQKDPLYQSVKTKMNWGILHRILGVPPVDVVERRNPTSTVTTKSPVFVTAFDMV